LDNLSTLALGVSDVLVDFVNGTVVDERTMGDTFGETAPDLEVFYFGGEGAGEGVVDAGLDKETVGTDAGLTWGWWISVVEG
jgi:hypothetical protein